MVEFKIQDLTNAPCMPRVGVFLYDGAETVSLGPDHLVAPLSTLWGGDLAEARL